MPTIQTNEIELYYEIHGAAGPALGQTPPLVCISGLGYPAWQWHKMLPYLAAHLQVILFDNRGVGQSDKPAGPYSASLLAADLLGLLDGLGIQKVSLLGHSMGGFIAQAFALAYPERLHKLILAATNFGGPRHVPITAEAMQVLTDVSGDPATRFKRGLAVSTAPGFSQNQPEVIEAWLAWRLSNPLDLAGYQAQMAIGLNLLPETASFEAKLPQVQAPALILFGAHDKVVPPANAELLARQLPDSRVVILPDAGHFFPLEVPAQAAESIIQFLTQGEVR